MACWGSATELSALSSGPLASSTSSLEPPPLPPPAHEPEDEPEEAGESPPSKDFAFLEVFAGTGALTAAVRDAGLIAWPADDVASGGTDFLNAVSVEKLKNTIADGLSSGIHLVLHLAPPCSSFSRARDRSWRTRLRSRARPQGIPGKTAGTRNGNLIARRALDLAEWAAAQGVAVSFENPKSSYMWNFLAFDDSAPFHDVVFSPCLFGGCFRKPTRLRTWNWSPARLDAECKMKNGVFSCGRTKQDLHPALEFGGASTADAAEYVPGACQAWALDIKDHFTSLSSPAEVRTAAVHHAEGRVRRHVLRGADGDSAREIREAEDRQSTAGMRNPADLEDVLPLLWGAMTNFRKTFAKLRLQFPFLQNLSECCGKDGRKPPTSEEMDAVRRALAVDLGLPYAITQLKHPATEWRNGLLGCVQLMAEDNDKAAWQWLAYGAPMVWSAQSSPGATSRSQRIPLR